MNANPEAWEKSLSSLGRQLAEALEPVARKLGVAAEHMYGVLVRQSIAESLSNIVSLGLMSAFLAWVGYRLRAAAKTMNDYHDKILCSVLGWIFTLAAGVMLAVALGVNLPGLVNPEYAAIRTLLDSVPCRK